MPDTDARHPEHPFPDPLQPRLHVGRCGGFVVDLAAAWAVVLAEGSESEAAPASIPEMMAAVEQVVSREDLAAAVEAVRELLPPPGEADDGDAEWRAALVDRYATVRPFIELLASVIPWGCTDAGRCWRRCAACRR
jgi:hypothetical protein